MARAGDAYGHAVMVGGVIVTAVAIDLLIEDPGAVTTTATAAVILGGPALYIAGNALFKYALIGAVPRDRTIAFALLVALSALTESATRLELMVAATAVTAGLAIASARAPLGDVEAT